MRSKFLVSTAALLAAMAMASAQNVPSGGSNSGPAAQSPGAGAAGQAQQGQKDQMQPGQAQSPSQTQQQGQGPQPGQGAQGKTTQQGQTQQGQAGGGGATLTTEQRTKIRETGPRAGNVNFSISVGTVVPTTVLVVAVPPTLAQWRGQRYFVVGNQMIIVDSNNRIVAVIAL
jgi:hypothetical protein